MQGRSRLLYGLRVRLDTEVRGLRCLVRVVDPGQTGDLARRLLGVQALHVALGADLDGGGHVDLQVRGALGGVPLADGLTAVRERRDHRDERLHAVGREEFGDEADPLHVGVPVLAAETEAGGEELADLVAVEDLHAVALGAQPLGQRVGDGGLARARQPGQPHGGALVAHAHLVRLRRFCTCVGLAGGGTGVRAGGGHQPCSPHSVLPSPAQRPARASSPAATRRVQGAQPTEA